MSLPANARPDLGEAAASAVRPAVPVAVGVLLRADGSFLLCSRPAGKVYAGYWEFPGGKLEPGEAALAALERELHEELGIDIEAAEPWRDMVMDYAHARVHLQFFKVSGWRGAICAREAQQCAWQTLPVHVGPLLPGTIPVLDWLAVERGHAGARFVDATCASSGLQAERQP